MSLEKNCKNAVIAIANGNFEALSKLYDNIGRMVFSVSFSILGNTFDAQDVLQETFIKITKSANTYNPENSAKAWILSIAKNLSLDILRKRARVEPDDILYEVHAERDDLSAVEVRELLSHLDVVEREIILYKINFGLSYKEIADICDISASAAQKRYQRAIEKLRKL